MRGLTLDGAELAVLRSRLQAGLAAAPPHALISLALDCGRGEDWLAGGFGDNAFHYWAQPAAADCRLGLGQAVSMAAAGPERFARLQIAFAALARDWLVDGDERVAPAAFLGFAFGDEAGEPLPNALLSVPSVLLQCRSGRCSAVFSCLASEGEAALERWLAVLAVLAAPRGMSTPSLVAPAQTRLADAEAERDWLAKVRAALADIAAGQLGKVVLTRSVRVRARDDFAVGPILRTLARRQPASTVFGFGDPACAFVGATPERLVSLAKGVALADALAGTTWLGSSVDAALGPPRLLSDDKNGREQGLVVDAVSAALRAVCDEVHVPPTPEVLRLRGLQHLRSRVAGRVKPGVGLFDLVARLHPTPAVGGVPTAAAQDWLRRCGEQRGAWYSGGVGWIAPNGDGEVCVALRCALIAGREAELFAGAGIVPGSVPEEELAETEAKLGPMLDALTRAAAERQPALVRTGTR